MMRKIKPGMIPRHHKMTSKTTDPAPTFTGICFSMTWTSRPSSLTGPETSSNALAIGFYPFIGCYSSMLAKIWRNKLRIEVIEIVQTHGRLRFHQEQILIELEGGIPKSRILEIVGEIVLALARAHR